MQTSKINYVFLIILGLFFIAACTSKTIQPPAVPPAPVDSISFSKEILPVFTTDCAKSGCHATGAFSPDLTAANAYNNVVPALVDLANPASSIIYTEVKSGGSMSVYWQMSGKDPNLVLYWIQQGAKNN